jgi:hypothetical protein
MAYNERSLDDYIDVATRIADFRARYPDGYLAPADRTIPYRIETVTGTDKDGREITQTFIAYIAAAYREPGDPYPGIGSAWEVFPGRTSFTRGSELMNAETSAWGRAIIALGASDSKAGIASREEVRNQQAEREDQEQHRGEEGSGLMSEREQAHHRRLTADTTRQPKKAERVSAGDPQLTDDPWTGPVAENAEDKPGSITAGQLRELGIAFGKIGISDRQDRLAACMSMLDLPDLESSKDLSYRQAEDLKGQLARLAAEEAGS